MTKIDHTHHTVLLKEAIDWLQVVPDQWYLDGTFGAGGHAREIIARGGRVCAFEYDEATYQQAVIDFAAAIRSKKLILFRENFARINEVMPKRKINGAIFDLGTNTQQLMSGAKGLSVYEEGPLDMRLDPRLRITAKELLLILSEKQIEMMLTTYGGEREAKRLAHAIVTYREKIGPSAFNSSQELANLVKKTKKQPTKHHPATKVFQALRIIVNDELGNIEKALPQAWRHLRPGCRLVTIAFHQGEDKICKEYLASLDQTRQGILLTKKPITPNEKELMVNPRARSAKMRVAEKLVMDT